MIPLLTLLQPPTAVGPLVGARLLTPEEIAERVINLSPHAGPPKLVIVPGDPRDPLVPAWTPTRAQVDEAVQALRAHLGPDWPGWHGTHQSMSRPWAEDYSIQAQGVTVPPGGPWVAPGPVGTKVIVLRGFCSQSSVIDWPSFEKGVITVMDGGACFFQAYYDVAARKIARFVTNGVA